MRSQSFAMPEALRTTSSLKSLSVSPERRSRVERVGFRRTEKATNALRSKMFSRPSTPHPLGLTASLVPVVALVGLLGLSFFLFGDAAASGPNQVALVFCSMVAIFVAWQHGHSIADMRDAGVASVTTGLPAIFILLSVGALIGTWALSGTLVTMVYYGVQSKLRSSLPRDVSVPDTVAILGMNWTPADSSARTTASTLLIIPSRPLGEASASEH